MMHKKRQGYPPGAIIEVCVEDLSAAISAERAGADQIELCASLELDGLTPGLELVTEVLDVLRIPLKVMIRCRGGDFHYSPEEIEFMADQIRSFDSFPVMAFVVGALTEDDMPDLDALGVWAEAANGTPISFHKASDRFRDIKAGFALLAESRKVNSCLSSGGSPTALEGIRTLAALESEFGDRLDIIAAGSITPSNIQKIADRWQGKYYHGRRILPGVQ